MRSPFVHGPYSGEFRSSDKFQLKVSLSKEPSPGRKNTHIQLSVLLKQRILDFPFAASTCLPDADWHSVAPSSTSPSNLVAVEEIDLAQNCHSYCDQHYYTTSVMALTTLFLFLLLPINYRVETFSVFWLPYVRPGPCNPNNAVESIAC